MVSALVAGVPMLKPLKIEAIISSESSSPLKALPHVSIIFNNVFSVCILGGFLVTALIFVFTRSNISFSTTCGSTVSLLSGFSITCHPSTSCTFPLAIKSPFTSGSSIFTVSFVSSNSAIGKNCIKKRFLIAS